MGLDLVSIFGVGREFEIGSQIVQGVRVVFELQVEDATIPPLDEKVR